MVKPNVQERLVDEVEIELREDFENAIEDAAMTHGLNIEYARSVAVRVFTREELQYALGVVT